MIVVISISGYLAICGSVTRARDSSLPNVDHDDDGPFFGPLVIISSRVCAGLIPRVRLRTLSSSSHSTLSCFRYDIDPYLQYRPPFARSLPVQILLTGIVFTLVTVLFIHLILTARYHWPLAPVNYVLQLSGVTTLLISLIATLHVILSYSFAESAKWPYMLSYIAVKIPPRDLDPNIHGWTVAERATWLFMNATTSGLIQVNDIVIILQNLLNLTPR